MRASSIKRLTGGAVAVAAVAVGAGLAIHAATTTQEETTAPVALKALPYGPDTCQPGYVWREARPGDHVCVTPKTRQNTWNENAQGPGRREPDGGAYGANTCKPGYVWREAFEGDVVCVTPDRRDQAKADNARAGDRVADKPFPDPLQPGTHTVVLDVRSSLVRRSGKLYPPTCTPGNTSTPTGDFAVGWSQIEADGDPCQAGVVETAVRFDETPLDVVPVKTIDHAILTYGEDAAQGCNYPPGTGSTCWRNGSGTPESKPNGCVAILGFPTVDWINAAPAGLIPRTPMPHVTRTSPREWDVSAPYVWQYTRSAPLGGATPPPFGFLLSGGLNLAQLHAEDNTNCVSSLSNLQLHITYTVPPYGGPYTPPR